MIRPYSGTRPITSDFGARSFYLNGKLVSDFHNGIDIGGVFDVRAAEAGTVIAAFTGGRVDANPNINTPANFIKIDHGNGVQTWYWHLSQVRVSVGQRVEKGQNIGVSGMTGYATGPHLHFAVVVNGGYRNPTDFVNFNSDSDSNLPVNNSNMDGNFITVNPGEGLFSVAQRAGLPANEDGAQIIYSLNQGWRGSWDWQSLNARMGPGDQLRVRADQPATTPAPVVDNTQIQKLQDQIDKLNKEKADAEKIATDKYEQLVELSAKQKAESQKQLDDLKESKRQELEDLTNKLTQAKADYAKLENTSIVIDNSTFSAQASSVLVTGIVAEVKVSGLKDKIHNWVDAHFQSNFMRQLLKYTWPAWLFVLVTATVAWAKVYQPTSDTLGQILAVIVPLIITFGGAIVQFLLTNYDKNKDNKVDLSDFTDLLK